MSFNTFGHMFRVTTFGESHGPAIGCVIDGCPPGLEITPQEIRTALERRATGRSRHTSQRREKDDVQILSGWFEGRTTGTPIALLIENTDASDSSGPGTRITRIGKSTACATTGAGGVPLRGRPRCGWRRARWRASG
jgi:chorismate synthase